MLFLSLCLSLSLAFYRLVRKEFSVYYKIEREKEEKTHETLNQRSLQGKGKAFESFVLKQGFCEVNVIN